MTRDRWGNPLPEPPKPRTLRDAIADLSAIDAAQSLTVAELTEERDRLRAELTEYKARESAAEVAARQAEAMRIFSTDPAKSLDKMARGVAAVVAKKRSKPRR